MPTPVPPPRRTVAREAVTVIGGFVALLWLIEIADRVLPAQLDAHGVRPWLVEGLLGIVFAPVLHGTFAHLVSNTVPLLVLGFVLVVSGLREAVSATAVIWVVGGLGTWLFGGNGTNHIGASVLVFGWIAYLVVRGVFTRRLGQILVGVAVLLVYGGALWGVLPGAAGVSWQMHLFGALGGVSAAWLLARPAMTRGVRRS